MTGGLGTEKLTVYSSDLTIRKRADSAAGFSLNMGVDVISSASTDNIDFVMSSASRSDFHAYLNYSYNKRIKNTGLTWSQRSCIIGIRLSFVRSRHFNPAYEQSQIERAFSRAPGFFRLLRWGRLNGHRPLRLGIHWNCASKNGYPNTTGNHLICM